MDPSAECKDKVAKAPSPSLQDLPAAVLQTICQESGPVSRQVCHTMRQAYGNPHTMRPTHCPTASALLTALSHPISLPLYQHLQTLDLSYVGGRVWDDTVSAVAGGCPRLRALDLTSCARVTDGGIAHLSALAPSLTMLDLSRCLALGPMSLYHVGLLTQLRALTVPGTRGVWSEDGERQLARCQQLTSVLIGGGPIASSAVPWSFFRHLPLLQRLEVERLVNVAIDTSAVQHLTSLTRLVGKCDKALSIQLPNLEHLDVTIRGRRPTDLMDDFSHLTSLRSLAMVGDGQLSTLAALSTSLTLLTSLTLHCTAEYTGPLGPVLQALLPLSLTLKELTLPRSTVYPSALDILQCFTALKALHVRNVDVGHRVLCGRVLPALEALNISGMWYCPEAAIQELPATLTSLVIGSAVSKLAYACIARLPRLLKLVAGGPDCGLLALNALTGLRELRLHNLHLHRADARPTSLSTAAAATGIQLAGLTPTLKNLVLEGAVIDNSWFPSLISPLTALESLTLRNCSCMARDGLSAIGHLTNLRHLVLFRVFLKGWDAMPPLPTPPISLQSMAVFRCLTTDVAELHPDLIVHCGMHAERL